MCVKTKPCFWLFVLLLLFVYHRTCYSIGDDTLLVGQSLSANQTLISQNGIFELGFFKPGASLSMAQTHLLFTGRVLTIQLIHGYLVESLESTSTLGKCSGLFPGKTQKILHQVCSRLGSTQMEVVSFS